MNKSRIHNQNDPRVICEQLVRDKRYKLRKNKIYTETNRLLLLLFFFLPIVYLGSGFLFSLLKFSVATILFLVALQNYRKKENGNWMYIVLLCLLGIYFIKSHKTDIIPSIIIFCSIYFLTFKSNIVIKEKLIYYFSYGCLVSGLIGVIYMITTGTYIKGGDFTVNELGISNLTVPMLFGLFIIYSTFKIIKERRKILFYLIINILLLVFIFILGKRGPMLFCLLSIPLGLFIHNTIFKRIILVILFAYPLYEPFITQFIVNNNNYIEKIFERSYDYEDIDNNPRHRRILVAYSFVSDIDVSDLWGYHKKLIVANDRYDIAHNHFHNAFLQLYYERGAISVLMVFSILLSLRLKKGNNYTFIDGLLFSMLSYLFMLGTNESLFMSGTCSEMLSMVMLLLFYARK